MIPKGSARKATDTFGIKLKSSMYGRWLPRTEWAMVSTIISRIIDVNRVTASLMFACRPDNPISTAPTSGINNARIIAISVFMVMR